MQEIYTTTLEILQSVVECRPNQFREPAISVLMKCSKIEVDALSIKAGMFITFPKVDRIASALQASSDYGFTKSRVRNSVLGAELDDNTRARIGHQPERKGHMAPPAAGLAEPLGTPK